jgi:lysophospholipase L1-like esterase
MSPRNLRAFAALFLAGLPSVAMAKAEAINCNPVIRPTPRSYPAAELSVLSRLPYAQAALVGDSIAAYWPQPLLQQTLGASVINLGFPQDEPGNVRWRLSLVRGVEPWQAVLLIVGVNSAWKSRTCDVAAGIERVVDRLHKIAPIAKIIVLSVMPHGVGLAASLPYIDPINARLAKDATLGRFVFVDPSGAFLSVCGGKMKCSLLKNWLHPTDAGYTIISEIVAKVLEHQ